MTKSRAVDKRARKLKRRSSWSHFPFRARVFSKDDQTSTNLGWWNVFFVVFTSRFFQSTAFTVFTINSHVKSTLIFVVITRVDAKFPFLHLSEKFLSCSFPPPERIKFPTKHSLEKIRFLLLPTSVFDSPRKLFFFSFFSYFLLMAENLFFLIHALLCSSSGHWSLRSSCFSRASFFLSF